MKLTKAHKAFIWAVLALVPGLAAVKAILDSFIDLPIKNKKIKSMQTWFKKHWLKLTLSFVSISLFAAGEYFGGTGFGYAAMIR